MRPSEITIRLVIGPEGVIVSPYRDGVDLTGLGAVTVKRLSRIEFNNTTGFWEVRRDTGKKVLFKHINRAACLGWEERNFGLLRENEKHGHH